MDVVKFRKAMIAKGINVENAAKELGISKTLMYRRLNRPGTLSIGNVLELKRILGLTNKEASDIFLN